MALLMTPVASMGFTIDLYDKFPNDQGGNGFYAQWSNTASNCIGNSNNDWAMLQGQISLVPLPGAALLLGSGLLGLGALGRRTVFCQK